MNCPTALASSTNAAQAVIDATGRAGRAHGVPPILTNWLGEKAVAEARRKFQEASIPTYESPTDAVKGFFYLSQHTKAQEALMRTPPRETERTRVADEAARSIMRVAATAGRKLLTEPEAKAVLSATASPPSQREWPHHLKRWRRLRAIFCNGHRPSPSRFCRRTFRTNPTWVA
jgi:acetyltransferase